MEFSRQEHWSGVAISCCRGSSQPRDQILLSAALGLAGRFFTTTATWEAHKYIHIYMCVYTHCIRTYVRTHTHTYTHTCTYTHSYTCTHIIHKQIYTPTHTFILIRLLCPWRILQTRILGWVNIPFSRGSSWPRDWTQVWCPALQADSSLSEPPGKPQNKIQISRAAISVLNNFPRLSLVIISSLSHVWLFESSWTVACHGISQAGILEWVAISSSRGSSWPRDRTCVFCVGRWILYLPM